MCTLHESIRTVRDLFTTAMVPVHDGHDGLPALLRMVRMTIPFFVTTVLCFFT